MDQVFSQLEGKNIGVVMKDANLDTAAAECALGGALKRRLSGYSVPTRKN